MEWNITNKQLWQLHSFHALSDQKWHQSSRRDMAQQESASVNYVFQQIPRQISAEIKEI